MKYLLLFQHVVRTMSVKLMFIPVSALLGMHSTYTGQLVPAAAAPLILCMCAYIGGVAWA